MNDAKVSLAVGGIVIVPDFVIIRGAGPGLEGR